MTSAPVIIITGASSGIGEATAHQFSAAGYRVVLAARRIEKLESLAGQIQAAGGVALPVETDVSKFSALQNLVSHTLANWGQIDVLFNNAGFGRLDWLEKLDPVEDIQQQLQVNLVGLVQLTHLVLPHMINQRSGHIINMSSVAGWIATPTYSVYAASKFGVRAFSNALRREVGVYGLHVSTIYPGGTRTEFAEKARIRRKTRQTTPSFLRMEAEQVARAVLSLSRRPRREMVLPGVMNVAIWFNQFFPGLMDRLVTWRFTKPERARDDRL